MQKKELINDFPKDFLWGTAASAPQTEGTVPGDGKSESTWDYWHKIEPKKFDENIGPNNTSQVYTHYKEDIKIMKDMNLNSYRTSISWTRLLPDGKTINDIAVAYYRDYFSTLIEEGIHPIINLFHFDMPMWLMEKGGWLYPKVSDEFAFYAKTCVELFGELINDWVTFNEPIVHVEMSYIEGFHYPALHNFKDAIQAGYNTMLAHSKAMKAMKEYNSELNIGIILNLSPFYARSDSPADQFARTNAELLNTNSFLDPSLTGEYSEEIINLLKEHSLLPTENLEQYEILKHGIVDYLGVNYYQPRRVQAPEEIVVPARDPEDLYAPYIWPDRVMNPYRGWEIYPEGLYDISLIIQEKYNNIPWYVAENGMGVADESRFRSDGIIQDDYRIDFLIDHLTVLKRAIDNGSSCYGFHMWTFVDCWSWLNGYRNRYGFIEIDLETQDRIPKKSSQWMSEFLDSEKK